MGVAQRVGFLGSIELKGCDMSLAVNFNVLVMHLQMIAYIGKNGEGYPKGGGEGEFGYPSWNRSGSNGCNVTQSNK